jgi:MoxR-like ATPase
MEEGNVTVDGKCYRLPQPFTVIATQNPVGSIGTQMLPESQLDRFMIKLSMGYPDVNSEAFILKTKLNPQFDAAEYVRPVININELSDLREITKQVKIDESILNYIARLANATRNHPMISLGLSPRGSLSLACMSRACALVYGRDYVIPDDIAFVFADVAQHRIILERKAALSQLDTKAVINEILRSVPVPRFSQQASED